MEASHAGEELVLFFLAQQTFLHCVPGDEVAVNGCDCCFGVEVCDGLQHVGDTLAPCVDKAYWAGRGGGKVAASAFFASSLVIVRATILLIMSPTALSSTPP